MPKNKSAILNKPVTISCPVSGVPPPLVKWYKDGKLLKATSDPNIMLSLDSRHLKIFRTQVSDAGIYICKAENDVGKIEKEFILNVQGRFVIFFIPVTITSFIYCVLCCYI